MLLSRSLLAVGLFFTAATAQIIDLNTPGAGGAQPLSVIQQPAGRADLNFNQVRALPQRLQDQNLSSNEVFEVIGAQQGAGVPHEFAGLLTGVAGPGSTADSYAVDEELFRPFCFNDTDCDSLSCNVSLQQLAPNDQDRQTILVQGLDNTFYCNAPGSPSAIDGQVRQEDCLTQIARGANQPNTPAAAGAQANAADQASLNTLTDLQFDFQRPDGYCTNDVPGQEMWGGNQRLEMRRFNGIPLDIEDERSGAPEAVSPRTVSDEVSDEPGDFPNQFGTSTLLAYCGQFIDHDLTLIEFQPPETRITITGSPPTDALIVFELSVIVPGSFPVLNPNTATGFIDLSMVYGNTLSVQYSLRKPGYLAALDFSTSIISGDPDFVGPQMFLPLTSQIQGNLSMPPLADLTGNNFTRFVPTAMHPQVANLFSAGDLRTNEQVMLISWHTLFLREHNRLIFEVQDNLAAAGQAVECVPETPQQTAAMVAPPGCELIYQLARRVNIAQWQRVVFDEYFGTWHSDDPTNALNDENALRLSYAGYDPEVNADIDIFFSTAAYRFGHTIVRTYVVEQGPNAADTPRSVFLGNAFFNTQEVTRADRFGTSGFLYGASQQCGSSLDQFISTGIRNFLFGNIPGSEFRNSDLLAFNVERCRDHGCPLYNDINTFFNYSQVETYDQIVARNAEANFQPPQCYTDTLRRVFGTDEIDGSDLVDNVDPMIAALIEPATFGQFGVMLFTVVRDQFLRAMVGDRYYYLNDEGPAPAQLASAGFSIDDIESITITDILNANSFQGREIVTDLLTGATQTPDPVDDIQVFSPTPFVAPLNGEGECCVNDGESTATPVCYRNATNPFQFDLTMESRCDALAALEAQGASFGAVGGFVAGTMLPLTFTPYNCFCNRYADEAITIEATLLTQSRSNNEIISQLQSDIAALTGEPLTGGPASVQESRIPATAVQVQPLQGGQSRVVISMNPSPNPDQFAACDVMFGMVDYNYPTSTQTQLLTSQNVVSLDCVNCPPLPSDFVVDAQGVNAGEAQLFGLPVAVGGAIIGGAALVLLIIVGCVARSMINKRNQQQMFTSGQESV